MRDKANKVLLFLMIIKRDSRHSDVYEFNFFNPLTFVILVPMAFYVLIWMTYYDYFDNHKR